MERITIRSPFNGAVVGETELVGADDALRIAGQVASTREEVAAIPAWQREQILSTIAQSLQSESEALASLVCGEAGKPIRDARLEVNRAVQTFKVAAEEAKRIGGEILPLDWTQGFEGRFAFQRRYPIGPILAITPFNFPLNLVAHKVAPAIACGCPMLLKPAPQTPLSALRVEQIVKAAGWPADAFRVVPCSNETAPRLVTDDRLRKLTFTGSATVGWHLKAAAPRKNATLELGGNAAVIVHEDADLDRAVLRIVAGGFGYAGQSCISVQRIYCHHFIRKVMTDRIVSAAAALRVGDPADPETQVGPLISEEAAIRAETWIREAVQAGGKLLCGGTREGALLRPAVLADVPADVKLACEEAFAPVVLIHSYDDFEHALGQVNQSRYGLQAGVFTCDWKRIATAWNRLEVGAVLINEVPTWRAEHMPYGGTKDSGSGREGIRAAIEDYTEPRLLITTL
jgi:glyceraldehyde-3-phosphate dehydrogenase (NADP+)